MLISLGAFSHATLNLQTRQSIPQRGFIGIADQTIVLGVWNHNVAPTDPLVGDPSDDGFVGVKDLNAVLSN